MKISLPPMLPRADKVRQHAPETYGNDIVTYRTTYTEKSPSIPQILLVEQPEPGSTLLPHYHASDQFQVFVDGDGKLGAHRIKPVSVHYTNRYTGYGPIVAGEHGVTYYVLRPSADVLGAGQYLFRPELREKMKQYSGRRRTLMADAIETRSVEALRSVSNMETVQLFSVGDSEPDSGTLAQVVSVGPSGVYAGPDPREGGGQVLLLLEGSAVYEEEELRPRSAIAVTRDEEQPIRLTAGRDGMQLLLMQYPRWSGGVGAAACITR